MTSINDIEYAAGRDAACIELFDRCDPCAQIGEPIGVSNDYLMGWYCVIGEWLSWHEGYEAAITGLMVCPYMAGVDDESRRLWLDGYACAMSAGETGGMHGA